MMSISPEARRKAVDIMLLREDPPYWGNLDLVGFLKRVWDLGSMPSMDYRFATAEGDIFKHMVMNDDWTHDYLLNTYFSLRTCDDNVFLRFLEECLSPVVISDEILQSELADQLNTILVGEGHCLDRVKRVVGRRTYVSYSRRAVPVGRAGPPPHESYEVVLSFAGENRAYVRQVAEFLRKRGVSVFYDEYEEVALWGKDLTEYLDMVYQGATRYCVMFISKAYVDKVWTNVERRSVLARAIRNKTEYILPARFEDVEVPGLPATVSYIHIGQRRPDELGEMILSKLAG